MVVIRESPNAKEAKNQPQWPPRSPHEALLSSPSGRKRLERIRDERSVSPSPRKRAGTTPRKALSIPSSDSDEDEDEETLQLKLKAIEAKLKLKKLQKANKDPPGRSDSARIESRANTLGASDAHPPKSALEPPQTFKPDVEVPLSPIRRQAQPLEPKSPARTLLGIDKGVRAQDVSLKRPRSARPEDSLSRSNSIRSLPDKNAPRVKSFSERIAQSRLNAQEQQTKEQRIQESRSRGFGLQSGEHDIFNDSRPISRQTNAPAADAKAQTSSPNAPRTSSLKRIVTAPNVTKTSSNSKQANAKHGSTPVEINANSTTQLRPAPQPTILSTAADQKQPDAATSQSTSTLEPYSGLHLSKRYIEHTTLTRTLQGKELYPIPRLLHEIIAPDYESPDCESDYVVLGVICSKSTPRDHKNNARSIDSAGKDEHARPKFMVFRLTDFKYEVDLFLFDTGFERWWKLKEGTLIAVLNPGIMPPRQKDTGAFSLKVTSSDDTILEIGRARDLGFCKSLKADGNQCTAWIDKRKTEVCEYHISLQVDKARADRMQFSTMTGGPGAGRGGRSGRGGLRPFAYGSGMDHKNGKHVKHMSGLAREGMYHDQLLHETAWLTPKEMGLNTASLLDREYTEQMLSKEAKRKRERDKEKEEELARSLGLKANGAGSEYMKHRSSLKGNKDRRTTTAAASQDAHSASDGLVATTLEPPDAASLGLLGKTAQQVSLAPVKRKINTSTGGSSSVPMGWSGAFKRGLLDKTEDHPNKNAAKNEMPQNIMLSPRKSSIKHAQDDSSPRKKARLMLDGKGVRIPGRESLGATPGDVFLEDEDDDELEIV